jgi:hypothetical protein
MPKKVEFHQANIVVLVRVLDGDKSDGLRQFQTGVILNTDAEWSDVRQKIDDTIAEIQNGLDDGTGD